MPSPTRNSTKALSGRTRYRTGFWGAQILQVEEFDVRSPAIYTIDGEVIAGSPALQWRDAREDDHYHLNWIREKASGKPPPPSPTPRR